MFLYSENVYVKYSEHAFPYGLGSENIFIVCVCEKCNSYSSGLECELYQK